MNAKNMAIGAVVGGIVLFVLGLLLFDVLFMDFYTANAGAAAVGIRATQTYWATALGVLAYGALITYLIDARPGKADIGSGLKMGALAGFLLWFTTDFTLYGYLDLWNLTVTILDVVLEALRAAISGAVVALVIGKLG